LEIRACETPARPPRPHLLADERYPPPASRGAESYHHSVGRKSLIVRVPKAVFGGLADEVAEIAA